MPQIIKTAAEYDELIKKGNVVVDFFATWCNPCRKLGEVMEGVEKDYPNVKFVKVDVDQLPEIASRYNVYSIPQVELLVDGKEKGQFVGFRYEDEVKEFIAKAFSL
jgi:thioredoxin 1